MGSEMCIRDRVKSEVKLQNLSYNLDDKNQFKEINGKIYYDNRKFYTNDDDYIKGFYNNNEFELIFTKF